MPNGAIVKHHGAHMAHWCLTRHIAAFEKHANIADNDDYYQLWQQTLEQLVAEKIARQSE